MEQLLKYIPTSFVYLFGLAVLLGVLIVGGTILVEWGKSLYNGRTISGKDKRKYGSDDYNGIERRSESRKLELAIAELVTVLTQDRKEFMDFLRAWRISHEEVKESIDEVKRKQEDNWRQAFDEIVPSFRNRFKEIERRLGEIK